MWLISEKYKSKIIENTYYSSEEILDIVKYKYKNLKSAKILNSSLD